MKIDKKTQKKKVQRVPLSRQQGIVISRSDPVKASYSEVTKKLKENIDLDSIGVGITEIRKTRSGGVSMRVGKGKQGACAAEKLRVIVKAVFGTDAGVRINSNTLRVCTCWGSAAMTAHLTSSRD